jgi:hypothetical protein
LSASGPRLPGIGRLAWLVFMQPIQLHRILLEHHPTKRDRRRMKMLVKTKS